MFPVIRSRWDARKLSRKLRQSLADPNAKWKIAVDDEGDPELSNGDFRIVLEPRVVRLLDALHVYHDGAEIWLPLWTRLRLRATARSRLIQDANDHIQELVIKKPRGERTRARRNEAKRAG
jgi:hypothetical protein